MWQLRFVTLASALAVLHELGHELQQLLLLGWTNKVLAFYILTSISISGDHAVLALTPSIGTIYSQQHLSSEVDTTTMQHLVGMLSMDHP